MRTWYAAVASVLLACAEAPPVEERIVPWNTEVKIDGSPYTPAGVDATWTLVQVPPGSEAALEKTITDTPVFFADRIGTYELHLTTSRDASAAELARIRIEAVNDAPLVELRAPERAGTDGPVDLFASARDPNGEPVSITWRLARAPVGSSAPLDVYEPLDGEWRGELVPDLPGTYEIEVAARDALGAEGKATAAFEVERGWRVILTEWSYRHEYSPTLDAVVFVSQGWLFVYHVADDRLESAPAAGAFLGLSEDGTRAVVGNTIYALDPIAAVATPALSPGALWAVLLDDRLYYATPEFHRYDLTSGENLRVGPSAAQIRAVPGGQRIYDTHGSSAKARWDIAQDPPVFEGHAATDSARILAFYEDGSRAVDAAGRVLRLAEDIAVDLAEDAALGMTIGSVAHSAERGALAVVPSTGLTELALYDAATLARITRLTAPLIGSSVPPGPATVFFSADGNRLILVRQDFKTFSTAIGSMRID